MTIELRDCPHCKTNGVLPMEGMICPNCKKSLSPEQRQEGNVLDSDSISTKPTKTTVSRSGIDAREADEISRREHLQQQSEVTIGVHNKTGIQSDEERFEKSRQVEPKAIRAHTNLDSVIQVSFMSGAGLMIVGLVMMFAGQTGTRPGVTIREYENAPKVRSEGFLGSAVDKSREAANYINLLKQWSRAKLPEPFVYDVPFRVELKREIPDAVRKQINSLERELDRFNLLNKQGSGDSYVVELSENALIFPGQPPIVMYRSRWWEDLADRGSVSLYVGFAILFIGCCLKRLQQKKS